MGGIVPKTGTSKAGRRALARSIRINAHEVLSRCVERGIARGFARAEKAERKPTRDTIAEHVFRETMEELGEVLHIEPNAQALPDAWRGAIP